MIKKRGNQGQLTHFIFRKILKSKNAVILFSSVFHDNKYYPPVVSEKTFMQIKNIFFLYINSEWHCHKNLEKNYEKTKQNKKRIS